MKIFSFDTDNQLKRDPMQDNLFNLFQKNIMNITGIPLNIYIVPREYEMRLDRISEHIYGTTDYVEAYGYQESGGTAALNSNGGLTMFSGYMIRAA